MICEQRFRIKKNGEPYSGCFCRKPELIENYAQAIADTTQTWDVHHRLESCFTQKFLVDMGLYFDVEPEALIFLTREDHNKIDSRCKRHNKALKGKKLGPHSEETKRKISEAQKGERNHMYGKHFSEEAKRKIRESLKGKHINRKDQSKRVLCIETGIVFESISDAYRKTGVCLSGISAACLGKLKTAGGYHWRFA